MLFSSKKSRNSNYFKIFLAVFAAIGCSIVLYFIFSNFKYISAFFSKIFTILTPVIIGIVFAYLFNPLVSRLEKLFNKNEKIKKRKKLGRALGIIIVYLITIVLLIIFVRFFIPSLLDSINLMFQNFPKYIENIFTFIKNLCVKYNVSTKFLDSYRSDINNLIKDSVVPNIDIIINNLASGITSVIKWILNIIVSIIISVYLIYDKEVFTEGVDRIINAYCSNKAGNEIRSVFSYIYKVFGGFMIAKLIDSLIIGVLTFIILEICNIPYSLLISLVVCVTNIIPFFGPFIGAIPSIFLLLMISPAKALEFGIIILIIQQFDGNILGPKLIGDKIGMKSFWVLFAILLFGGLYGFVGMILAVPIFACILEFTKNNIDKRLKEKRRLEEEKTKQEEKKKTRGFRLRLTKKESA